MFRKISLFALALLSLTAPAWGTIIYVSGDQTGTWSADTVIVTAEVRVPPGTSLTILPGVEVLFSVYCKLIVDNGATLRAVGTAADSIRFDVLPPNTTWRGVRFLSASDSSRLEYCILKNSQATGSGEDGKGGAIYCSHSNPTISHSTLQSNLALTGGGGIYCYSSSPSIGGNTISGNSAGSGSGIYCYSSSPSISGNTISSNSASFGGGIYCFNSSPTIIGNTISGNLVTYGGGINCNSSSPSISGNTISGNQSYYSGGIYCANNSSPTISNNTITGNLAVYHGGGIYCASSNPSISGNTISGNSAGWVGISGYGGGIYCYDNSNPSIIGNTISANSATYYGGGICCSSSSPTISGNTISGNSVTDAFSHGGGIYCSFSSPAISGNRISGNSAASNGGGIACQYESSPTTISNNTLSGNSASYGGGISCSASTTLVNCILWGNGPQEIYGSPLVTYSDIQGGYAGTGNMATYPAFVDTAQHDYRLQWGSPCIDSGDPNPMYNDPDGTRADMGCYYYDQSMFVRILLTPYNAPIQIPAAGGSFDYGIQATNIGGSAQATTVWCNVTLPSGFSYGPVLGPVTIPLASGQTLSRVRTQVVPAGAPAGLYHYNAFAVAVGDTSEDNFVFTKLGFGDWGLGIGGWTNTGEAFDLADVGASHASPLQTASGSEATLRKESFGPTMEVLPNPFNPLTVLSYKLQTASPVNLRVYDTAGRLVTELINGWREAGAHEVTFDGSRLPSGIYFAKLRAGDYSQGQKMVLMK